MSEARLTSAQRKLVADRAHGCCEYCWSQEKYSPDSFSVEHILPLSRGGNNHLDNLAFSCQGCNNRKYTTVVALDQVTQERVDLYHPRQHKWADHFAWNEDYSLIIGLSPTGRATVARLQLNRSGLVNLRRVLFESRQHPPVV